MENQRKSYNQNNDCNFLLVQAIDLAFLLTSLKFSTLSSKILVNMTQLQESVLESA